MRRLLASVALALTLASPALAQNYTATPGTGLTFGSKLVGGVNYNQFVACDPATPSQCIGVNASGQLTIANNSFGISGTLPGFAATPTVNLGTIGGAATQTTLASVLTALGSPFQAGGSIGNTAFGISGTLPAFAATPTFNCGTGCFQATQPVSGTFWPYTLGQQLSASSVPVVLPAAQITALTPPTTVAVTQATAANLNMTCANCSGSGASGTDGGGFVAGSSIFAPSGGFFQTTATSNPLTNGQWGVWQLTANRAGFVNLRNASGAEIGTASAPVQVSLANTGSNGTAVAVSPSGAPWSQNLTQISGAAPSATNPIWAAGAQAAATTMQSAAVANGNGTNLTVTGYQTALVNVNCSVACSGGTTINFEGTDATGTFFSVAAYPVAGNSTAVNSTAASGQFWVPVSGLTSLRARISAYSAGTITVTGTPVFGVNASLAQVANTNANGQQTMANSSPVVIASNQSALTVNNATAANLLASVSGATSNASSAVATGSANVPSVSYNYGYNGTTWDQLQVDGSKNLKVAGLGQGATGSAPPANATYNGTLQSGATGGWLKGVIQCDQTATYDASTSGSTQMVALAASQTIYVCGYTITTGGTATNVKLVYGTGTNCATGATNLTPAYQLVANGGIVDRSPFWGGMKTASANALCVNASAANAVQATVYYAQF